MNLRASIWLLSLLSLVGGCGRRAAASADGGAGKLMISGSSTVAPLAAEIALRFEKEHPGTRIEVQTGGSSRGIKDARAGLVDLGMASRALKGEEAVDLRAYRIARDGVALIVHASNPIDELDDRQVRAIFTGEVTNWNQVGGPDGEITVVNKASGRATLEVFLAHFGLEERDVRADIVIGDNQQGIKTIAGNPLAIGYVSIGSAEVEVNLGTAIRLLAADGIEATLENVTTGRFPISRPLNLVCKGDAQGLALQFIEYCTSEAATDLIVDLYFAPVAVSD